ncbi:MAG: hypothetical protein P0S95_02250 [Rhabdochlamydiaceae bacterium]|nr:hypothetical protein [Candidatus Amphrikana amoebophyrae]
MSISTNQQGYIWNDTSVTLEFVEQYVKIAKEQVAQNPRIGRFELRKRVDEIIKASIQDLDKLDFGKDFGLFFDSDFQMLTEEKQKQIDNDIISLFAEHKEERWNPTMKDDVDVELLRVWLPTSGNPPTAPLFIRK